MRITSAWTAGVAVAALLLAACSPGAGPAQEEPSAAAKASQDGAAPSQAHGHDPSPRAPQRAPLRPGERIVDVRMPSSYTP